MLYIPKLTEAEAKKGLLPDSEAGSIFSNRDDGGRFYRVTEQRTVEPIGGAGEGVKVAAVDISEEDFEAVANEDPSFLLVRGPAIPLFVSLKKTSNNGIASPSGESAWIEVGGGDSTYSFGEFPASVFGQEGEGEIFLQPGEGSAKSGIAVSGGLNIQINGDGNPSAAPSVQVRVWYVEAPNIV